MLVQCEQFQLREWLYEGYKKTLRSEQSPLTVGVWRVVSNVTKHVCSLTVLLLHILIYGKLCVILVYYARITYRP